MRWIHWLGWWLTFTLPALAQTPDFDRYPRREIDRSYTLPSDLREIRLGASFLLGRASGGAQDLLGLQPLLQYESGHSETFSWLFNPLPFGFKAQPIFTEHQRLGFLVYYEVFATGVSINERLRFGDVAIELEATGEEIALFFVKTRRMELVVRALYQIADPLAVSLKASYGRYGFGSDYIDAYLNGFARDSEDRGWASANAWSGGGEALLSVNPRFDVRLGITRWHYFANGLTSNAWTGNAQIGWRY